MTWFKRNSGVQEPPGVSQRLSIGDNQEAVEMLVRGFGVSQAAKDCWYFENCLKQPEITAPERCHELIMSVVAEVPGAFDPMLLTIPVPNMNSLIISYSKPTVGSLMTGICSLEDTQALIMMFTEDGYMVAILPMSFILLRKSAA